MKRSYYKKILWCIVVASSIGFVSCSDSDPEPTTAVEIMVRFSVVTSGQMETRSTPKPDDGTKWGDQYKDEAGDVFDNRLLKEGFKVVFTSNDCNTVLSTLTVFEQDAPGQNGSYAFRGIVPPDDVTTLQRYPNAKIHVIANAGYVDISTSSAFGNLSFTKAGQASTVGAIPMWGVHTVDFSKLKKGEIFDAGSIDLLRSLAKVEIKVSTDVGNVITGLTSASVSETNGQGYLLPNSWNNVSDTKDINFEDTMHEYYSHTGTSGNMLPDDTNAKTITFYLPEIENDKGQIYISLAYKYLGKDGKETTGANCTVSFAEYAAGKPTANYNDIVRNHLYRFTVSRKQEQENAEITIKYTVCPMKSLEANIPEFS